MMRKAALWCAITLLLLPVIAAQAQDGSTTAVASPASSFLNTVSERIEREVNAQDIVGLSVGLIIDGEVAHTLHFGYEDRDQEIPTTDDTMYRWASISKPLTAIVAVQLAAEGKLDLDRDVREYVPEFPEKPWTITARQLLSHQGGIVHYTNGEVIKTKRKYDVENPFADTILALDTFKESPLVCEPGTKYSYTTHGYMLLGAVAERAGGDRYDNLVRTRIAEPLGMTTLQPDYQWQDIPHRTPGYRRGFGENRVQSWNSDVSWKLPGGGWISNIGDMARFAAALVGDDFLARDLKQRMWTRQCTRGGQESRYGLGFRIDDVNGILLIGHTGSQEKTRTNLLCAPEKRAAVVIMCNTEGTDLHELSVDLLRMIVEGQESPPHDPDDYSACRDENVSGYPIRSAMIRSTCASSKLPVICRVPEMTL